MPDRATTNRRARVASSQRRDEILAVAATVFARKGIAGATVRDIADEAGILSGSLYHHFESKDHMVAGVLEPFLSAQEAIFAGVAARAADQAEALRMLVAQTMELVARYPSQARLMHSEAAYLRESAVLTATEARRQGVRKSWVSVVRAGVRSGRFRKDVDADVVVRAMFDAVLSSTRWLPPQGRSTPKRIGRQLSEFFLSGLAAR